MSGTWVLRGITGGRASCEHCGRDLARCFRVENPAGEQMVVGRVCATKLTGHSWSLALAERIERRRQAQQAAQELFGERYREATAVRARQMAARPSGTAGAAGEAISAMESAAAGTWAEWQGDVEDFVTGCLTSAHRELDRIGG